MRLKSAPLQANTSLNVNNGSLGRMLNRPRVAGAERSRAAPLAIEFKRISNSILTTVGKIRNSIINDKMISENH